MADTKFLLANTDLYHVEESTFTSEITEVFDHVRTEFKLEIDNGDDYRTYILNKECYDIGRGYSSSIIIDNRYVSSHHASLRKIYSNNLKNGYTYQIVDGNDAGKSSRNGVFVNGDKVHKHDLRSGDVIGIGPDVKAIFVEIPYLPRKEDDILSASKLTSSSEISYAIIDPCIVIDTEGNVVDFNCSAESKLGYKSEEAIGRKLLDRVFVSPWKEEFHRALSRFLLTHDSSTLGRWNNIEVIRKNGQYFDAEISVNSVNCNGISLFVVNIRDITTINHRKSKLIHQIYEDSLTGLGNRRFFLMRLEAAFKGNKINKEKEFAVLFIDLDRFKTINDTLGHNIGDELLIRVARRIKECLRDTDTIARQGGDEFTVLIEGEDIANSITQIAIRLRDSMNQPYTILNHRLVVTASIGVLLSSEHYKNTDEMLRDADFAMYRAKASGRGDYIIFDDKIGEQASQALRIEQDLRHALERKELFLDYQPIISLSTGKLTSFEALIRWNHSELGRISPAEFIPMAENTGSIISIGNWVLRQACEQIKAWQDRYDEAKEVSVSVNLSIKQIEHASFVEEVLNILEDTHLDPRYLKIEITETLLMENMQEASSKLCALKKMGIQIYIDDFGTGYSSFGYLHDLPINALKIDRSFVNKLNRSGNGYKIIQSIISLAQVLGIEVIAEGVENMEQLDRLSSLQCDKVQGYYFSKPLNVEYAETFLINHMTS